MNTNIGTRDGDRIEDYDSIFNSVGHFASNIGLSLRREGFVCSLEEASGQVVWRDDIREVVSPNNLGWIASTTIVTEALTYRFANVIRLLAPELRFFEEPKFEMWRWHHLYDILRVRLSCDYPEGMWMSIEAEPRGQLDLRTTLFEKFPSEHELLRVLSEVSEDLFRRERFKIYLEEAGQSWEPSRKEKGVKVGAVYVGFDRGTTRIRVPDITGVDELQRVISLIEAFEKSPPRPIPFSAVI